MKLTSEDPIIFIGPKPFLSYVTATTYQFLQKNAKTVTIKARGKFISRAVDVAEVVTRKFLSAQVRIDSITTNSSELLIEGKTIRVSTIEIRMVKYDKSM